MVRSPRFRPLLAFTMIELLIVMALLAILSGGGFIAWQQQTMRARDAKRKEDFHELQFALSAYKDDNGCFLAKEEFVCGSTALDPYMREIPCDPVNSGLDKIYRYERPSCGEYGLYTNLERTDDADISRLGCESGCGPSELFNYFVTSESVAAGSSNQEGTTPGCGGQCTPNACNDLCCPGANYRCNSAGNLCLYDSVCGL